MVCYDVCDLYACVGVGVSWHWSVGAAVKDGLGTKHHLDHDVRRKVSM